MPDSRDLPVTFGATIAPGAPVSSRMSTGQSKQGIWLTEDEAANLLPLQGHHTKKQRNATSTRLDNNKLAQECPAISHFDQLPTELLHLIGHALLLFAHLPQYSNPSTQGQLNPWKYKGQQVATIKERFRDLLRLSRVNWNCRSVFLHFYWENLNFAVTLSSYVWLYDTTICGHSPLSVPGLYRGGLPLQRMTRAISPPTMNQWVVNLHIHSHELGLLDEDVSRDKAQELHNAANSQHGAAGFASAAGTWPSLKNLTVEMIWQTSLGFANGSMHSNSTTRLPIALGLPTKAAARKIWELRVKKFSRLQHVRANRQRFGSIQGPEAWKPADGFEIYLVEDESGEQMAGPPDAVTTYAEVHDLLVKHDEEICALIIQLCVERNEAAKLVADQA